MKIPNRANFLQSRKDDKENKEVVVQLLDDRLQYALKDKGSRVRFIELLKTKKISAKELMSVGQLLASSKRKTNEWIEESKRDYKFNTLSDVTEKGGVTFFKIMIIVRDEWALDIAEDISFKEAVKVILERVFFQQ